MKLFINKLVSKLLSIDVFEKLIMSPSHIVSYTTKDVVGLQITSTRKVSEFTQKRLSIISSDTGNVPHSENRCLGLIIVLLLYDPEFGLQKSNSCLKLTTHQQMTNYY